MRPLVALSILVGRCLLTWGLAPLPRAGTDEAEQRAGHLCDDVRVDRSGTSLKIALEVDSRSAMRIQEARRVRICFRPGSSVAH
jgi:hypothetical protein